MKLRLGELCAGYGGLAKAIEEVFDAETVWVSEFEEAPSKILAHHWPNAHNYGDMTKINWYGVEPIEVLGGGTPCQDLSHAGKRKGMTEGTRSNLWVNMREAIAVLRPKWVVWENVRGAYSAEADSDVEFCPGCMGSGSECNLRALGRVLGDLSDLGYDTEWRGLRASDVGAPHGRFRVFVLAYDPRGSGRPEAVEHHGSAAAADDGASLPDESDRYALRVGSLGEAPAYAGRAALGQYPGEPSTEEARPGSGNGSADHRGERPAIDWGPYEASILRWERIIGRAAPRPTEPTGRDQGERLSPRFTEWMMGMPDGWITSPTIGISRNEQLKACGNGVVPQQAVVALQEMLTMFQQTGMVK